MTRALFFGDLSWDTTVAAPWMPAQDEKVIVDVCLDAVGGVAANSAAACALAGADVLLASTVGSDAIGDAVMRQLERIGITVRVEVTAGTTARAIILLDEAGEKRLFLYQGARMYPSVHLAETIELTDIGWMHTAVYDLAAAAVIISRCREASIPWSIDLEPATIPADLTELAPHLEGCAVVIVNARSADVLGGSVVERLRELGVESVVETLGPDGVRVHGADSSIRRIAPPALRSAVRDTTGAGDAFAGWLIAETLRGSSLDEAAAVAVEAASHSVQSIGTIASYPTREEITAILTTASQEGTNQ